ncbi:MAG: ABC-type Mn2+/Zn2+ transport system ATPase subunit [Planctomycetota bacterium]|jgi:ABC-type Mn2+/Zn2+ transport system ATPase subunit
MPLNPGADVEIELSGAAFGYHGRPIVRGVDLTVSPGDFIGVLGPNGAGKTTLFRGILGLLPALEGRVRRSHVRPGYVPQRDTLDAVFPLTVTEVVTHGGLEFQDRLGRLAPAWQERVDELLEQVDLKDQRRTAFASLSGGQRQRALLARALLPRPNILVLDEPTSGVDVPTQARILELLRHLNEEQGLAILLVSHHLASTRDAVKSIVWVENGEARSLDASASLGLDGLEDLFRGAEQAGADA